MSVQEATLPREPRPYDFRRPTALAREHSRVLELAFETFARQWATQLTAKVRVLSQVTCEQLSVLSYDDYASGLPATTAMVVCAISEIDSRAVIQFPTQAALGWITVMLGGTRPLEQVDDRPFTPIEHALVRRLMDDALEDVSYSFGPLLSHDLRVDAIQYNSRFAQAAPMAELMVVARFAIRVGDRSTEATMAFPSRVLLEHLGEANPTVPVDDARTRLGAQLAFVPVDVAVRFAEVHVRPQVVLDLAVGDLLPLPHRTARPLEVAVEGQIVGTAAVGSAGNRLAVVITDPEGPSA